MKTLLVITGPTGVGKTELSLLLAKQFGSPILNADSRQLYRDIPIGTAAPTKEQLDLVPHYFVGTLGLSDYYSAAQYENDVLQLLKDLFQQHQVIVMSGGSMMYIDAVCKGIDDIPTIEIATREFLQQRLSDEGLDRLLAELKWLDPDFYDIVDKKNKARIVHALEICYQTGKPYSSFRIGKVKERDFNIIKIGLNRPREILFDRINQRVSEMMKVGLLSEAERVYPYRHLNSLNTVGYKELFQYLSGEWDLEFALNRMRKNTRVYAKKQLTWYKKDPLIRFFSPDDYESIQTYLNSQGLFY